MALLTPVAVPVGGVLVAHAAVNTTDTVAVPSNGAWLHVKNAAGGAITVTLSDPNTTAIGNPGTTTAVSVAAGAERLFALTTAHNSPTTGVATITYSSAASVTATVFVR